MWAGLAAAEGASPDAVATVERAASGAAALGPEIRKAVQERLGIALAEGYGLTETSPGGGHRRRPSTPRSARSVARCPASRSASSTPTARTPTSATPGEILVRGDNVFVGYWNDPEATTAVLTDDGWLHTGDIGFADESGHVFLSDRAKDLVIVSGFNVYPAEVEDVLVSHPAVKEAAVVGIPSDRTGEAVKAFVVLEDRAAPPRPPRTCGTTPTATWPATSAPPRSRSWTSSPTAPAASSCAAPSAADPRTRRNDGRGPSREASVVRRVKPGRPLISGRAQGPVDWFPSTGRGAAALGGGGEGDGHDP